MMRLTQRELRFGAGLLVLVAAWALFSLGVRPALERIETLNRVIPEKQNELERLRTKANEYVALHDGLSKLHTEIASQEKTFELLPFVESLIQECGLTNHVVTMNRQVSQLDTNYHETVVQIQMENLTLRQLYDFLLKIQSSRVWPRAKKLHIQKNVTNTDLLDSLVEIHNLELTQS